MTPRVPPSRSARPTWATPREALTVIAYGPHLRRSATTAAIVGTILFLLNQLDVVLADGWTVRVVIKGVLTYLVPFCVANVGILSACKRPRAPARGRSDP